jgi:hypothetical protein
MTTAEVAFLLLVTFIFVGGVVVFTIALAEVFGA